MNLFTRQTKKAVTKRFLMLFLTLLTFGITVNAQIPTFTEILNQYYNPQDFVIRTTAQTPPYGQQFNNYGFEDWETVKDDCVEPLNWNSFMTAEGKNVIFIGNLADQLKDQIEKSTQKRPGSTGVSSARIFSTSTMGVVANGNMTTGRVYAGSISANNDGNYNYTKRSDSKFNTILTTVPDSLTVWIAFKAASASTIAKVNTTLHGDVDMKQLAKSGDSPANMVCATANKEFAATSTSGIVWKRLTIPFTAGPHNDPRYILTTFTTNKTPGQGSSGDELYIDDICLIYNPSLNMGVLAQTEFDGSNMNIEVPFTLDGSMSVYNLNKSDNEVIAQLSDASGSFANPTELGRVTTNTSGTISGVIPAGLAASANYKVRVVSTNYPMVSNETNITISYPYVPVPEVTIALGTVAHKSAVATFTPNADCSQYYFLVAKATESVNAAYVMANGEVKSGEFTKTWNDLTSNTDYKVYALPVASDNTEGEMATATFKTNAFVPQVEITKGDVMTYSMTATFTPNADCAQYYFAIALATEEIDAEDVKSNGELVDETHTHAWENLNSNTEYKIYALPVDIEGNEGTLNSLLVKTKVEAGVSEVDLDIEKLSETSVTLTATPNENTVLYHYIVMTKAEADAMGEDALMQMLNENENYLTDVDVYTMTVESNVAYYVVAQGKNADDIWGVVTKLEFVVEDDAVEELGDAVFEIYPNPAKEYVRITSDSNIEELSIFTVEGKMVYSQSVNQQETMINVAGFDRGTYVVRMIANDKIVVKRIMVL